MNEVAAGMGALGFWLFIAAIVVAGIWYDARRRESQQETLRRIVESGRDVDTEVLDRIVNSGTGESLGRDLRTGAVILIFAAPGLAVLGLFLGRIAAEARSALLGIALLAGFIAAGLFVAAGLADRSREGGHG